MKRPGTLAVSLWFAAVFCAASFQYGAVRPRDLAWFAIALAVGGALLSWRRADRVASVRAGWIALLPVAAVLQTVPLPFFVLAWLSPVRAADWSALRASGSGESFLALSASPGATWLRLLEAAVCVSAFYLARGLSHAAGRSRRDLAVLPILASGSLEAVFGLIQAASGQTAVGTFVNRNHFACLMAMTVPLAMSWRAPRPWMAWAAASIPAAALVASGSRGGLVASAVGLAAWHRTRMLGLAALGAASVAAIVRQGSAPAERLGIWRDTLRLIADHPWTGCGLGAFEHAFPRYQSTAVLGTVDFAHQDYLQLIAELGLPLGAALIAVMLRWLWRAAPAGRSGFAAAAAFAAHGLFDFNLYIPVNAAAAFWAAGTVHDHDA